ncbi:hypothetical protein GW17_00049360 [Ensete ventricosum]|nr:hypothetical protein GW17_00049360 [Ensete ventricosum]
MPSYYGIDDVIGTSTRSSVPSTTAWRELIDDCFQNGVVTSIFPLLLSPLPVFLSMYPTPRDLFVFNLSFEETNCSKSPRQGKAKKKPIKVVYISNPMRVTTSPAKFRGLVQKLTGRDSNVADTDVTTDSPTADSVPGPAVACDYGRTPGGVAPTLHSGVPPYEPVGATPYEVFDDVFAGQILDNFPGFERSSLYII